MPIPEPIHVFASHKGGTGKTQLCFQCAAQYANDNPNTQVLVLDMTELGDLSKRCLGGTGDSDEFQHEFGGMFDLVEQAEQQDQGGVRAKFRSFFAGEQKMQVAESSVECAKVGVAEW